MFETKGNNKQIYRNTLNQIVEVRIEYAHMKYISNAKETS